MKILSFFLYLHIIFALRDLDPDLATQINAGLDPDPQPLECYCVCGTNLLSSLYTKRLNIERCVRNSIILKILKFKSAINAAV
jgi:hypothetical protein